MACYKPCISSRNNTKISQFILDGTWNETIVNQHVPPLLVPKVHFHKGGPDVDVWKLKDDGLLTCALAWELTWQKKSKNIINTFSWHKIFLLTMESFERKITYK